MVTTLKLLSKNEIQTILDRVSSARPRTYLTFLVLAYTGVRVSELIRITPQDILMGERQIIIRGKGGKIRNVDISYELLLPLRVFIKGRRLKPNERIFPVTRHAVKALTYKYAEINPHAFRHSYAVELLRKTYNIRYVQAQLGHSSLSTTQIYLKYIDFAEDKQKLKELWK